MRADTVTVKGRTVFWIGIFIGLGFQASVQPIIDLLNVTLTNIIPTVLGLLPEGKTVRTVVEAAPGWAVNIFAGVVVTMAIVVGLLWVTRLYKSEG